MAQEAAVPAGFWGRVQKMIDDSIAAFARSGFLRNAAITGGAGLTIADGGSLALKAADGTVMFYIGPVTPSKSDGSPQPGWTVRRADGTVALQMRDAFPSAGAPLRQALNWYDRGGNVVLADDTNSGQGVARPYLSGGFVRSRFADFTVSTTSPTFVTLFDQYVTKQQPQLEVAARASMDTSGTTGELRVLVNGVALDTVKSQSFAVATNYFGPLAIAGAHMDVVYVEIQGRVTSASGALRVEPMYWKGRQS